MATQGKRGVNSGVETSVSTGQQAANQSQQVRPDYQGTVSDPLAGKQNQLQESTQQNTSFSAAQPQQAQSTTASQVVDNTVPTVENVTSFSTFETMQQPTPSVTTSRTTNESDNLSQSLLTPSRQNNVAQNSQQDIPTISSFQRVNQDNALQDFIDNYKGPSDISNLSEDVSASSVESVSNKSSAPKKKITQRIASNVKNTIDKVSVALSSAKPGPQVKPELSSRRFKDAERSEQQLAKDDLKNKHWLGHSVTDKLIGISTLGMEEVSVGDELIAASLRQPDSDLIQAINVATGIDINPNAQDVLSQVIDTINQNNIRVTVTKSPVNEGASSNSRVLRVHTGRGVGLHPVQAKMFNADFDGDDASVVWDQDRVTRVKTAMQYMIDPTGTVKLDQDFFLVPQFAEGTTVAEIEQELNNYILVGAQYAGRRDLIKALAEYCHISSDNNLKHVIKTISDMARNNRNEGFDRVMSNILGDVYESFRLLRIALVQQTVSNELPSSYQIHAPLGPNTDILDMLDDMQAGRTPINFQDYKTIMSRYIGEIDNKNVHFRLSADIAKLIKWNKNIEIGSSNLEDLYDTIMAYGVSSLISNRLNTGEQANSISSIIQELVINRVGTPKDYNTFKQFLDSFIPVYRQYSAMINTANLTVTYRLDMKRSSKGSRVEIKENPELKDLVTPFLDIYGKYTVEYLFDQYMSFSNLPANTHGSNKMTLLNSYRTMPVKMFALNNRLRTPRDENKPLSSYNENQNNLVSDFITMIADKKTSAAANYAGKSGKLWKSSENLLDIIHQINEELNERHRNWQRYSEAMTELIYNFSPKLFSYYGMDNPAAFLNSEFGKKLLQAKTADEIGGIYQSMLVRKRLDRISKREEYIDELLNGEILESTISDYTEAINARNFELASLSSSSMAWRSIMLDMSSTPSQRTWTKLKQNYKALFTSGTFPGSSSQYANAESFWKSPSNHESLTDFMKDPDVNLSTKMAVLSDVVRVDNKYLYLTTHEAAYQLELDNGSVYSDIQNYSEHINIFDTFDNFDSSVTKWNKANREKIEENFNNAARTYRNQAGTLDATLQALTDDAYFCDISTDIYADAIAYILDPTFDASEKGSQIPGPNVLYQSLVYQLAGKNTSDVTKSDNDLLGLIGPEDIAPRDLIKVLADTSGQTSFKTYDDFGNAVTISRISLTGSTSEKDLWTFFENNPHLFMMIQRHQITSYGESRDVVTNMSSTMNSLRTMDDVNKYHTYKVRDKVRNAMMDHYRFAGMVALSVPTENQSSRTLREKYKEQTEKLTDTIITYAIKKLSSKTSMPLSQEAVDSIFGITEKNPLHDLSDDIYNRLRAELYSTFNNYVYEVADILRNENQYNYTVVQSFPLNMDLSSVAMYYDVKQTLSGAKTEVSTGVEGTETYKNAPWIALLSPVDKYMENEDGEVIEVPEGTILDNTLDDYGRQISSVCRYFIVKRDKGAEEFNLKVKKFGDDKINPDSISKIKSKQSRLDPDEVISTIQSVYENEGLFAARVKLARYMKINDSMLGYTDMNVGNYTNLTELMLTEQSNGESTELVIRSLEQIVYAIRNQISLDLSENGSVGEISNGVKNIANNVAGLQQSLDINAVDALQFVNTATTFNNSSQSIYKARSSSFVRNFELMRDIVKRNNIRVMDSAQLQQSINESAKKNSAVYNSIKKYLSNDIDNSYHFLGVVGNNPVQQPGPQSMWVIDDKINESELDKARSLGMTVVFDSVEKLGRDLYVQYASYIIEFPGSNGELLMLPFFDMELNGATAYSNPAPASFQRSESQIVWSYEDSFGEYALGDSDAYTTQDFVDRINPKYNGSMQISFYDIFANTFDYYANQNVDFIIEFADEVDIKKWVINEYDGGATIDLGISDVNRSFDNEQQRMQRRIQEFRDNYEGGTQISQAKPDQIVTWLRCTITDHNGNDQYVLAPLVLFRDKKDTLTAPSAFDISGISINRDTSTIDIDWSFNDSIENGWLKMHEGAGAANKFLVRLARNESKHLKNGRAIDMIYSSGTTASRRLGSNKRLSTMTTLMFAARTRPYGYNFAEHANAFPNNPDIKEKLTNERMSIQEWRDILNSNPDLQFSTDKYINAFLRQQVSKCLEYGTINPSDLLCSHWNGQPSGVWWEFDALYETQLNYQNYLMRFLNSMMPDLCPPSINEYNNDTLFKPSITNSGSFDYGCLQMQVPHVSEETGQTFYTWENVYAGWTFGGEDFSGMSKPNPNGSSEMMDKLNTMALQGQMPLGRDVRNWMRWATASRGRIDSPNNVSFEKPKIIKELEG